MMKIKLCRSRYPMKSDLSTGRLGSITINAIQSEIKLSYCILNEYIHIMPSISLMTTYLMQIGDIVKRKRADLKLTQRDLEESSGVTQSMISKVEAGDADNVSIEILRKLSKALSCSVIDLLPESDKKK